jgi:hypothetical protein
MIPHTDQHATAFAGNHHAMAADPQPDVIDALLQALNGDGDYRLVDLGGELFLEPRDLVASLAQDRQIEMR